MKKIKILLILVVIFQLGACAQNLSLVKTERVNINDVYSVRPSINFNQLADSKITVWNAKNIVILSHNVLTQANFYLRNDTADFHKISTDKNYNQCYQSLHVLVGCILAVKSCHAHVTKMFKFFSHNVHQEKIKIFKTPR